MLVIKDPAPDSAELAYVRRALEQGELVALPTDTVYGLAAHAPDEDAVARLYALKQRPMTQPTAVAYSSIRQLQEHLPWLGVRATWAVHALLPGPWTLVVDNPDGVLPWLTGGEPAPLGLRVPAGMPSLPPIAATSANVSGAPTVRELHELDESIRNGLACAVDRGVLPTGVESTVLDLVDWERGSGAVRVLRDTHARAGQAIAVLAHAPD